MKIAYTTHRNTNGSSRVKITIEELGRVYADFCRGARISGDAALNFDAVIDYLRNHFRYRVQLKNKTPNVTSVFECEHNVYADVMDAIVYAATQGAITVSRYRYMNGSRRATHNEYYSQFVTPAVLADARHELPRLMKCERSCFNDHERYTKHAVLSGAANALLLIAESTTYSSFKGCTTASSWTSVFKAAARQAVAEHLQQNKQAAKKTEIRDDVYLIEYYNGFSFERYGKVIAPRDVFALFKGRVPAIYNDVYGLLSCDMLLDTNKKMLHRIIISNVGTGA